MYAVIFTAKIKTLDLQYSTTAQKMRELAFSKYGCTAFNSAAENGTEIVVSYWSNLEDIQQWKTDIQHLEAQSIGKQHWYDWYRVDVVKIERSYEHPV